MEPKIPDLQTELEKEVFRTSHPAGFPSFLGRFLLVKVGWYFNEIEQEWREVWMYHQAVGVIDPTGPKAGGVPTGWLCKRIVFVAASTNNGQVYISDHPVA